MPSSKKDLVSKPFIYTFFLILLLGIAISLGYSVTKPFLNTIVLSIVLAGLFQPVYIYFKDKKGCKEWLASLFTVLIIVFAIIIPATIFFVGIIGQGVDSIAQINVWLKSPDFAKMVSTEEYAAHVAWVKAHVPFLEFSAADIQGKILSISRSFGELVLTSGTWLAANMANIVANFLIMIFLVFSFLKDGTNALNRLRYLSPLKRAQEDMIIDSLRRVSKSVLFGSLFVALLQGIFGGLGLAYVGIPALFWGTMMGFASLVPVIGTGIIWVPAVIFLSITGRYNDAIILCAWCAIVVTSIDTILRPMIVKEASRVSTVYVFLAIIGGISAFGPLGILYGPLVLAFLLVMLEIYSMEFDSILLENDKE